MSQLDPNRRFQIAQDKAVAAWAAADPARCAALAGCSLTERGIVVPYFGRPHLVTHPTGDVIPLAVETLQLSSLVKSYREHFSKVS